MKYLPAGWTTEECDGGFYACGHGLRVKVEANGYGWRAGGGPWQPVPEVAVMDAVETLVGCIVVELQLWRPVGIAMQRVGLGYDPPYEAIAQRLSLPVELVRRTGEMLQAAGLL